MIYLVIDGKRVSLVDAESGGPEEALRLFRAEHLHYYVPEERLYEITTAMLSTELAANHLVDLKKVPSP